MALRKLILRTLIGDIVHLRYPHLIIILVTKSHAPPSRTLSQGVRCVVGLMTAEIGPRKL